LLELPDLNQVDMDQIVSEAKKQLRNLHPQWTDHSPHDPGITILELLAYLKENQHQAINTIGPKHKMKYLELLNIQPEPVQCSYTEIIFSAPDFSVSLPGGTKLKANNIIFETLERHTLFSNELVAVMVKEEEEKRYFSLESKEKQNRDWYALGREPKAGNQFYLSFTKEFPAGEALLFKFQMFEDYPVKRNPLKNGEAFFPLVELQWEYYGEEKGVEGWHPLEVKDDTTHNLLFPGFLTFQVKGKQLPLPEDEDENLQGFAFRCTLVDGQYDVPPRVRNIFLNCLPVWQQESLFRSYTFSYRDVKEDRILLDSYLAYFGYIRVFTREQGYWVELDHPGGFQVEREESKKNCRIRLTSPLVFEGEESEDRKEEGPALKVIAMEKDCLGQELVGSSTGFIHQAFELEMKNILTAHFSLMVGEALPGRQRGWVDWQQVNSRNKAGRNEKCYELETAPGRVKFGDNRRGAVPPKGEENLLITDCVVTRAEQGNIQSGNIDSFKEQDAHFDLLTFYQLFSSTGGREGEDLARAEQRMLQELKTGLRAVRIDDFARLAQLVPGLMIEHVKPLPLFKPGLEKYPEDKADNCVTLVIEPYSETGQGKLTAGYRKNIVHHLEKYRLITTEIHVVEPTYVGLEIFGEIIVKTGYSQAEKIIEKSIVDYVNTFQRRQQGQVHLSHGDLYGTVDLLDCVSYIRYLFVEPFGRRVMKSSRTDTIIPADCRFYVKSCELTLLHGGQ